MNGLDRIIIRLRDRNEQLVAAWRECFAGCDDVEISHGEIFGAHADAIVSPANSFGYMDGGIDLAYVRRFGWELQDRLQCKLRDEHDGELPVGQAAIIETLDACIPFMISAPTMRIPADVSGTLNAYLAFRAALCAVKLHNASSPPIPISSVLCPGMATAIGNMPPQIAAGQMHAAYLLIVKGRSEFADTARKTLLNHHALLRGEPLRAD
jgi:O-acetyl-ADP-ribose deacetylase (regulator of RNase III)